MEGKPITEYVNAANLAGYKKAYRFVPKGGESAEEVRKRAKCFLGVIDEFKIISKIKISKYLCDQTDYGNFSL